MSSSDDDTPRNYDDYEENLRVLCEHSKQRKLEHLKRKVKSIQRKKIQNRIEVNRKIVDECYKRRPQQPQDFETVTSALCPFKEGDRVRRLNDRELGTVTEVNLTNITVKVKYDKRNINSTFEPVSKFWKHNEPGAVSANKKPSNKPKQVRRKRKSPDSSSSLPPPSLPPSMQSSQYLPQSYQYLPQSISPQLPSPPPSLHLSTSTEVQPIVQDFSHINTMVETITFDKLCSKFNISSKVDRVQLMETLYTCSNLRATNIIDIDASKQRPTRNINISPRASEILHNNSMDVDMFKRHVMWLPNVITGLVLHANQFVNFLDCGSVEEWKII